MNSIIPPRDPRNHDQWVRFYRSAGPFPMCRCPACTAASEQRLGHTLPKLSLLMITRRDPRMAVVLNDNYISS